MTIEETRRKGTTTYNRLVTVAVGFGSLTYGYCASIIGSTIGQPGWYEFFDLPRQGEPGYGRRTTNAIATANGLFSAGGAIGSLFIMWSATPLGRKRNIQIGALLALLGGALQGGARNLEMFQAGRFITGFGIGVLVTICPMYLSELAPPAKRGWLVGHHAIFLVFGYVLASWLGYACYHVTAVHPSFAWRFPLAVQCLSPTILLVASNWMPHSPRWLLQKGRNEEAWKVLQRLRQSPEDPEDLVAREEYYQSTEQLAMDTAKLKKLGVTPCTAALKLKSYRKRMIVGFLTQWGAEFGGPLVINNYLFILLTNMGLTGAASLLLSAIWLTTAVIFNPLGAWLHDKVNSRRCMFMTGFAGIVLTVSLLLIMLYLYAATTNEAGNAASVFLLFLYIGFQGTFCDTTMYLYVSEIFPTEIRPIGMGFSLFGQFASSIILLQSAPTGFVQVGWKYYLVIIVWSALFIPVIYFYFPETAGLSLEEINAKFGDDVAVHINDVSEAQRQELDDMLRQRGNIVHPESEESISKHS